jgi:uncharacterized protein YodC (DUF2158 family)
MYGRWGRPTCRWYDGGEAAIATQVMTIAVVEEDVLINASESKFNETTLM